MNRIIDNLTDPIWWFHAVFIAVLASLLGALMRDALRSGLAKISKSYKVRKKKRDKELEDEINLLSTNQTLFIYTSIIIFSSSLFALTLFTIFIIIFILYQRFYKGEDIPLLEKSLVGFTFFFTGVASIILIYFVLPRFKLIISAYSKYRKQVLESLAHQTSSGDSKKNTDNPSCFSNLSETARDILKFYLSNNETALYKNEMFPHVSDSKIKLNAALNELLEADVLYAVQERANEPRVYKLTDLGTKYLADVLLS